MKNIALLSTREVYYNHGDDHDLIGKGISEWHEISDEDYLALMAGIPSGIIVICRENLEKEKESIDHFIQKGKEVLEYKERQEQISKERLKKSIAKRLKTTNEKKLKHFQELAKELKDAKLI